jgi:hypothetical protein
MAWHSACPMSGAFEAGTRAKCPIPIKAQHLLLCRRLARLNCPPGVIFVYPANCGCGLSRRALWFGRRGRQPGIKAAV